MNINDITNTTCIIEGCGRRVAAAYGRGLCAGCYTSAKRLVDVGKVSWEELENARLALRKEDPFTKAYNRARTENR